MRLFDFKSFKMNEDSNGFVVKVFTKDELEKVIWGNGGMPKDESVFKRIKYFSTSDFSWYQDKVNAFFVVLFQYDRIIGVAKVGYFEFTAQNTNTYSISYFSIDKDYRKQGLSHMMCDALFQYAKEKGYEVSTSAYTFMGKRYLQKLFNSYALKYDVKFYDKQDTDSLMDNEDQYVSYKDTMVHKSELED